MISLFDLSKGSFAKWLSYWEGKNQKKIAEWGFTHDVVTNGCAACFHILFVTISQYYIYLIIHTPP